MSGQPNIFTGSELVGAFKRFYADCKRLSVDDMQSLYHDDVIFRDPVHDLRGLTSLHSYLDRLSDAVTECRFEYLDQLVGEKSAYIKWNMHYKHPKLANRPMALKGVTHIEFNDRIHFHQDVYDLGEMFYEHVPLVGSVVKKLKKRLA